MDPSASVRLCPCYLGFIPFSLPLLSCGELPLPFLPAPPLLYGRFCSLGAFLPPQPPLWGERPSPLQRAARIPAGRYQPTSRRQRHGNGASLECGKQVAILGEDNFPVQRARAELSLRGLPKGTLTAPRSAGVGSSPDPSEGDVPE